MKLSLFEPQTKHHDGMVYNVCWNPLNNELISIGDDKQLSSWHIHNESLEDGHKNVYIAQKILDLSHHCISTKWCPDQSFMACGFVDGSLRIISFDKSSSLLKMDKIIENAHHGAVTCLSWNSDGSALITGGEDGVIKQWSRSGNLRSKLFQSANCIHSVSWSPNNQAIVYASDKFVTIQSVQNGKNKNKKSTKWKAHCGIVLCLDWNVINNLLITGGEDCYYRIWDEFGRLMYSSNVFNYPISTVLWAPNGKYFGAGSYNMSLLCDYQGWIYQEINSSNGSALCMDWSEDSSYLAIGYGNGQVLFAQITNRRKLYQNYYVTLNQENEIRIQNILSPDFENVYETLEFNELVINFEINYDILIVITIKKCYIYQIESITTPQIISLKQTTIIYGILLTRTFFMLINSLNGINIIGYDGTSICQFNKSQSIKPKLLNPNQNICATNEIVAMIDVEDPKCINIFDPFTSQSLSQPIKHSTNIVQITLNTASNSNVRKIAFIDNNKDLFVCKIHCNESVFKLKTIVDSISWHPHCDILFALSSADKQLIIWYYPDIVWCDTDLIKYSYTTIDTHNMTNNAKIISIENTLITIRKEHGDEEIINFSPLPLTMYNIIRDGKWNKALRLCHICGDQSLWASLTGLAIDNSQIEIALQGLTALQEADKILFLKSIQNLPLQIHRDAELALYRKNVKSAENILLQNDLIYRVIELNMRLFKFKRALQIAIDYKQSHPHLIDIVIAFRNKYLKNICHEQKEDIDLFIKYKNEDINWNLIKDKCQHEMDKEYEMAGIKSTQNKNQYNYLSFLENTNLSRKHGRKELESLLGIHSNIITHIQHDNYGNSDNDNDDDDDESNIIDID